MILGLDRHPAAHCFDELDAALSAMGRPDVVLNGHAFPDEIPPGATVYNLENLPLQVSPHAFPDCNIWEYSALNLKQWKAAGRKPTYVPVGYHASMERFRPRPWDSRDVDVAFTGCLTERRCVVLDGLVEAGLVVGVIGPGQAYAGQRDRYLARSKLVLNMLVEDGRTHPVLRSAHLVANRVPMLAEWAPETPRWVHHGCRYEDLVNRAVAFVRQTTRLTDVANDMYEDFKRSPMELPA